MSLGQSVIFLEIPLLAFLALHTKRKRCGYVGTTPCYSQSQVVSAWLHFFFWKKDHFRLFYRKGCSYINMLMTFPL